MYATETPIKVTVKCAWCGRVIKHGLPWPPHSDVGGDRTVPAVSHGICKGCFASERIVIRKIFHHSRAQASA